MNIRKILTIAILLLSTIFYLAANCDPKSAEEPEEKPVEEPTIVGTWVNPDYNDSGWPDDEGSIPAKQVITIDGSTITTSQFKNVADTEPIYIVTTEIIEEWTDNNGARWYKLFTENVGPYGPVYGLAKVNSDNYTVEGNSDLDDYPTEINTEGNLYAIMYRQSSYEPIVGIWVNSDYNEVGDDVMGKIDIKYNTDGTLTSTYYEQDFATEPNLTTIVEITEKWTDSQGRTFYKMVSEIENTLFYSLGMVSSDYNIAESVSSPSGYPTVVSSDGERYVIYYRQTDPSPGRTWETVFEDHFDGDTLNTDN